MTRLTWDRVGSRTYENGIDKGVLYLPGGVGVPWNGLTAVDEKPERDTSPVYYDGKKISEGVTVGDFAATLSAVTYPEELTELEGAVKIRRGVTVGDQPPKTFALCYRTMIGNDTARDIVGYKIHVIWNVTAIPSDKSFNSVSDDPELVEFQWDLVAMPTELPGVRPTAQLTIDTRKLDPWLLEELEAILYGSTSAEASLLPMEQFFVFLRDWYRVRIVDHGDGTWTAIEARPGFITLNETTNIFEIINVRAFFLDEDTYRISDTEQSDDGWLTVSDNGDGTWTAQTDNDAAIDITPEGFFEIKAVDVTVVGPGVYRIDNQTSLH